MVPCSGGVRAQAWRDLPFLLAPARLASSGKVHHAHKGKDARIHVEVGPRTSRCDQGHDPLSICTRGWTGLTLHHEGYSKNSEAKKIRDEHVEGWTFFLRKLPEQS